jgi:hypothetical protein
MYDAAVAAKEVVCKGKRNLATVAMTSKPLPPELAALLETGRQTLDNPQPRPA